MSPFETATFAPICGMRSPGLVQDPLLLHAAMSARSVTKEDALTLMNSPLVQFGVTPVLLGFAGVFDFTGDGLFSPFDSREQIAAKIPLLPAQLASNRKHLNSGRVCEPADR
jgi:hypothetical protein